MHSLNKLLAGLLALLLLAGCAPSSRHWRLTNVTHVVSSLKFRMPSTAGGVQTQADYRGDVVMLYFGYTNCPDVCPTTLAKLATSIRKLGKQAQKVRVLFVTVDPKRDTLAVLKRYVDAFDPRHFVGLRPDHAELDRLIKRYRVVYSYGKPDKNGNYVVNHSAAVFIFGPHGEARLLGTETAPEAAYVHDLRQLLKPSGHTAGPLARIEDWLSAAV